MSVRCSARTASTSPTSRSAAAMLRSRPANRWKLWPWLRLTNWSPNPYSRNCARIPRSSSLGPSSSSSSIRLQNRLPEQLRRHVGKIRPPVAPHVAFLRRNEAVLDLRVVERLMKALGRREERVGLAAGDVEQFQLLVRRCRIGEERRYSLPRISAPV